MARLLPISRSVFSALTVVVLLVAIPDAMLAKPHRPAPTAPASASPHQSNRGTDGQPVKPSGDAGCPPFPGADHFVQTIDNRYLPLVPGTTYTYRVRKEGKKQRNVVNVTNDTKEILGVTTTVVRDTVRNRKGGLVEDTRDWYAQDQDGNVWYFGEDTKEYKHGHVVTTEGSWEAGVNGASPGIIMEADPHEGDAYGQECAPGVAEDRARIFQVGASTTVPFGSFDNTVVTEEFSLLEPGVLDHKYYAPCVGVVRETRVQGGHEEAVLVDLSHPSGGTGSGCNSAADGKASSPSKSTAGSHSAGSGKGVNKGPKGGHHGSAGGSGSGGNGHTAHSSNGTGSGGAGAAGASAGRHQSRAAHGRAAGHHGAAHHGSNRAASGQNGSGPADETSGEVEDGGGEAANGVDCQQQGQHRGENAGC